MTKIKICGFRDPEMVTFAAEQGAEYIGIIFAPKSRRVVSLKAAKAIIQAARKAGAEPVGVFKDQSAKDIAAICETLDLKIAQLHGEISCREQAQLPLHLTRFYGMRVDPKGNTLKENHQGVQGLDPSRDMIFYDGMNPGSGEAFDWDHFHPNRSFHFFLAGGLNPDNVSQAIENKQPTGVDVASGIEDPKTGNQDPTRIASFIKRVKEVS